MECQAGRGVDAAVRHNAEGSAGNIGRTDACVHAHMVICSTPSHTLARSDLKKDGFGYVGIQRCESMYL